MKTIAILEGPQQIYRGVREIDDDKLTDLDVEVPADCDLVPGKYAWVAEKKAFVPLSKISPVDRRPDPDAQIAIALGFIAMWKAGIAMHATTLDWLDAFFTSIEMMESIDGGKHAFRHDAAVVEYLIARGLTKGTK